MSFKEAKRTFLIPEWSRDIFLLHISFSLRHMKQHIKNEVHNVHLPPPKLELTRIEHHPIPGAQINVSAGSKEALLYSFLVQHSVINDPDIVGDLGCDVIYPLS